MEPLSIRVTTIDGRHHVRLLDNVKKRVADEMACREKQDIKYCAQYLLRMAHKCGVDSNMADRSRHRKPLPEPVGKIWYPSQIPVEKR